METKSSMKIFLIPAIFFAVFFAFGNEAKAATYYVSPSGNDNNSGSIETPFKTIQEAADIVNPGDTVIVKDGTYTNFSYEWGAGVTGHSYAAVHITRGGTNENGITFKSENKWGAVIDGGHNLSNGVGILIAAPYITIDGFEIRYTEYSAITTFDWDTNTHINIINNHLHHIADRDRVFCELDRDSGRIMLSVGNYSLVNGNLMHDLGMYPIEPVPYSCRYPYTALCTQNACVTTGGIWEQDVNINYAHNHVFYGVSTGTTITNNIIYNITSGWLATTGGTNGWSFINNIFHNNTRPIISNGGFIRMGSAVSNIKIENNIAYEPKKYFILNVDTNVSGTVKNNIIFGSDNPTLLFQTESTLVQSGNLMNTDPLFVDLPNKDFHLQSISSPAIDKGLATNAPAYDFDGNLRTGNPDIGAYEYIPGDPTPPASPTGLSVN